MCGELVINALWPSDAIRRHKVCSSLGKVMPLYITRPSYHVYQCWLITNGVRWYSTGAVLLETINISIITIRCRNTHSLPPHLIVTISDLYNSLRCIQIWGHCGRECGPSADLPAITVTNAMFSHSHGSITGTHDEVIKWKHFPRYWPYVREIHRSPVNFPHKGQWHGALIFSLICTWINGWVNNREAGDLIRHRAHYDVTVNSACYRLCNCFIRSAIRFREVPSVTFKHAIS